MLKNVCLLILVMCISCACGKVDAVTGVPDVVNSISTNRDQYLTVIAYRDEIEDKQAFAEELIQMCVDNSFETIKFSTDMGYATSIRMNVYLNEKDWENNVVAMKVSYTQESVTREYDIVNNPEMFKLVVE